MIKIEAKQDTFTGGDGVRERENVGDRKEDNYDKLAIREKRDRHNNNNNNSGNRSGDGTLRSRQRRSESTETSDSLYLFLSKPVYINRNLRSFF